MRPTRRVLCSTSRRDSRLIWSCSGRGLPCRFRYRKRGALLPHLFTLTADEKPKNQKQSMTIGISSFWHFDILDFWLFVRGGIFSVALSVASPHPAVSRRPALWSSDFPQDCSRDRPADSKFYLRRDGSPAPPEIFNKTANNHQQVPFTEDPRRGTARNRAACPCLRGGTSSGCARKRWCPDCPLPNTAVRDCSPRHVLSYRTASS